MNTNNITHPQKNKLIENQTIIIIDGYLFNVTKYKKLHPGGSKILEKFHYKDATEAFNNIRGHCDTYVYSLLDKMCCGKK